MWTTKSQNLKGKTEITNMEHVSQLINEASDIEKKPDKVRREDLIEAVIKEIEEQKRIITDKEGNVWLVIPPKEPGNGSMVVNLSSKEAFQYYNRLYLERTRATIRLSHNTLKNIAESLTDSPSQRTKVYLRWAMVKNADGSSTLWHDLNRSDRIGIRATATGWELVPLNDVLFRYQGNAEVCPDPVKTDIPFIQYMDKYLRILTPRDRVIFTTILVSYMLAGRQNVITITKGSAGSGKSTLGKFMGLFMQFKSEPEGLIGGSTKFTDDQIMARISNQAHLSYDNINSLTHSDSDVLCRVATGTELSTRKFYTEIGLVTVARSVPTIMTAISDLQIQPDLMDRAYIFTPDSDKNNRIDDDDLWSGIYKDFPEMYGAMLSLISYNLAHIDEARRTTPISELPRMSGFGLVGVAITPELNKGEYKFSSFLTELRRKRTQSAYTSMDNDKLIFYLYQLMKSSTEDTIELTPTLLAEQINKQIKKDDPHSKSEYTHLRLPENLLQRKPTLRDIGIDLEIQEGQYQGRKKNIILRKVQGVFEDDSWNGIQLNNLEPADKTNDVLEEDDYVS